MTCHPDVTCQASSAAAVLVGWSDGGIIALLVSMRRPDLVSRQVVIGANHHVDGLRPLEPESLFATSYAERSPDGKDHFDVVMAKTVAQFSTEPTLTIEDIATISAPTLVLVGDDDLIELNHTESRYEALPAGRLAIVPGASHAVPLEAPAEVTRLMGLGAARVAAAEAVSRHQTALVQSALSASIRRTAL
jgi:pimeloyl-ACP methyl ester carboxylesterase